MNTFLIFCILISAYFMLNDIGRFSIYVFCSFVIAFNIIGNYIPAEYGTLYYIGAAIIDLLIIAILSQVVNPTKATTNIQDTCKAFIMLNFIGWVLYMNYASPEVYTFLCALLYSGLFLSILTGGKHGDATLDSRDTSFYSNHPARDYVMQSNEKEARH